MHSPNCILSVNKRKNVVKVNMEDVVCHVKRRKNLDLGPAHPVPSKLNIMETIERLVNILMNDILNFCLFLFLVEHFSFKLLLTLTNLVI